MFYGPAPRSHADEVRARIAAEHEAARLRREANPEPAPVSARFGSRCPICLDEWAVNELRVTFHACCARLLCDSCAHKFEGAPCPICQTPIARTDAEVLAQTRRHVENEVPEAIAFLGNCYRKGHLVVQNLKKAKKLYKRAIELGNVDAMRYLGTMYEQGNGVKLDLEKAMQLFRLGTTRGDNSSRYKLALMLRKDGRHEEAFPHWQENAERGCTTSEYFLARCFEDGDGVKLDEDEARRWFARAAAKGDAGSQEALRALDGLDEDDESLDSGG